MEFEYQFLWRLRQQVDIKSSRDCDYQNDFGIDECIVRNFFKNYVTHLEECAQESGLWDEVCINIQEEVREGFLSGCSSIAIENVRIEFYNDLMYKHFDNENTLREYYEGCEFNEESPLFPY